MNRRNAFFNLTLMLTSSGWRLCYCLYYFTLHIYIFVLVIVFTAFWQWHINGYVMLCGWWLSYLMTTKVDLLCFILHIRPTCGSLTVRNRIYNKSTPWGCKNVQNSIPAYNSIARYRSHAYGTEQLQCWRDAWLMHVGNLYSLWCNRRRLTKQAPSGLTRTAAVPSKRTNEFGGD